MKPKAKPYWLMAIISSGLLLANSACAQQHETHAAASAAQAAATAQRAAPQAAAKQWQWQTLATGLNHPWGLAFLPDGRFLVSERSGNLRVVDGQGQISAPVAGLPQIEMTGQGGLLDVVLDDDFARNRRLYFCFSEPGKDAAAPHWHKACSRQMRSSSHKCKRCLANSPKYAAAAISAAVLR